MENYIKDRFEEFKADSIICTKKEKYYLITLEQKKNFKKWLVDNFNKLNGNKIDPTITEPIKNFNSVLSRLNPKTSMIKYSKSVSNIKRELNNLNPKANWHLL